MIIRCAWCERRIRQTRKAISASRDGRVEFFCSKECSQYAQKLDRYVAKVRREVGEEDWGEVYAILLCAHFQRRKSIECKNCLDYIQGRCEGGEDPFECFFRKVKKAKEMGLTPDDIVSVSFIPLGFGMYGATLGIHDIGKVE